MCSLRDELSEIEATDTVVFGVSVQDQASHLKFIEKESLTFHLLVDTEHKLAKAYGVFLDEHKVSARATFIIDKAGFLRMVDKEVNVGTHGKDVLKALQTQLPAPLKVGNPASGFVLPAHDGKWYSLEQFRGKKNVVLAFYPKDFTGG